MGGMLVLRFATTKPAPASLKSLSGVVAYSPMIQLSVPPAKVVRFIATGIAKVFPSLPFPANVPAAHLSRDPAVEVAVKADPLMKPWGTLGGLSDMFAASDYLFTKGHQDWPQDLPLLMVHGTDDKICSYPASRAFYDMVTANDKQYIAHEGAYHEIFYESDIWQDDAEALVKWMKSRGTRHTRLLADQA